MKIGDNKMPHITMADAIAIIDAAIMEARSQRLSPLAVMVLDAGGHPIAFKREDGASFFRFEIANGKAWGAVGMGFGTRELAERAARLPNFVASLSAASQGRMIPSPGGVLVENGQGDLLGAVGISGDKGENDETCAIVGIKSAGLIPKPGRREK
jgi:uncharacterized protein GlcG (DUF336 family)